MELSKEFYDKNYLQFSDTRFCLWDALDNFSKQFCVKSLVLDAGCGNGKNIKYMKSKCNVIGFDICKKFVELCQQYKYNVIESDILDTPFDSNLFDFIYCIAVIHHFDKESDRLDAIKELVRILKPNGKILISMWAYESDEYSSKKNFVIGDNLVSFGKTNSMRYFYIYDKTNLESFCQKFDKNIKFEISWDRGNWILILTKYK